MDQIVKMDHSVIQHGTNNNRIYLMKLAPVDMPDIIDQMERMARTHDYTKIFCKVPDPQVRTFLGNGYCQEAYIPKFYRGNESVYFLSKFLDSKRKELSREEKEVIEKNLALAEEKKTNGDCENSGQPLDVRVLGYDDTPALAAVYRKVFKTYPFPIHDEAYLKKTMDSHIVYFGVFEKGKLIAASSAEMDRGAGNAEMTDFATLPGQRGKGLATALLSEMESEMKEKRIQTVFTIARAASAGMNITFAKCGYLFTGTLVNNTNISGSLESMNVWYKHLA